MASGEAVKKMAVLLAETPVIVKSPSTFTLAVVNAAVKATPLTIAVNEPGTISPEVSC